MIHKTHSKASWTLLCLFVLSSISFSQQDQLPIIDGDFSEWTDEQVIARYEIPKGSVGIKTLSAVRSGKHLFICLELTQKINLQGGPPEQRIIGLSIAPNLNVSFAPNGATYSVLGGDEQISWYELGFECLPTYASDRFELKLNPKDFQAILKPPKFEYLVNGVAPHVIDGEEPSKGQLPFPLSPKNFRIANLNTLENGLADKDRQDEFGRLLNSATADVYCFQEEWDRAKFENGFKTLLPKASNHCWYGGCAIASTHNVTRIPMELDRAVAAMVESDMGEKVLVITCHFQCSGYSGSKEDDVRVRQAKQIVREIKKLRQGQFSGVAKDSPVVLIGNYNLVGSKRPLEVLNDAGLTDVLCRGPRGSACTWRGFRWQGDVVGDGYWPGRIDYATISGIKRAKGYVLDSEKLTMQTLKQIGIRKMDSLVSDHLMLVLDCELK